MKDVDITLLLLYKDNLAGSGEESFSLTTTSNTIKKHLLASKGIINDSGESPLANVVGENPENLRRVGTESSLQQQKSIIGNAEVSAIPEGFFVWGWWRKAGETHDKLLQYLKGRCDQKLYPHVLLYNNYLRRIYGADLYDLYFEESASTVQLPVGWMNRCPGYYSNKLHFCGCYFVLKLTGYDSRLIGKQEPEYLNSLEILPRFFVDDLTFDEKYLKSESVISPQDGSIQASRNIIDSHPMPLELKVTDQTIFALRSITQRERADKAFRDEIDDNMISGAFMKITAQDILKALRDFEPKDWSKLGGLPKTLTSISKTVQAAGRNLIRFDLFVVSWIFANEDKMNNIFSYTADQTGTQKYRDAGKLLIEWALETDPADKLDKAAGLFVAIWHFISKRWTLEDISDYFKKLPEFETVAFATKYGLQNKFYRDHLNHNIRAGLLCAYLSSCVSDIDTSSEYNEVMVGFLAGLFHDMAHPLASLENTVVSLQKALEELRFTVSHPLGSLVDRAKLKNSVNVVALISSLPTISKATLTNPFSHREALLAEADKTLLYEQMLCSMSDEHALLSATVLFECAAEGNGKRVGGEHEGFQQGLDYVFRHPQIFRELFALIQAIALHDRRAAGQYTESKQVQPDVPRPLSFEQYRIPTLTYIADELQEWGRPIAQFGTTLVEDFGVELAGQALNCNYVVSITPEAVGTSSYCFWEHFHAKVRTLGEVEMNKDEKFIISINIKVKQGLMLSLVRDEGFELGFPGEKESSIVVHPPGAPLLGKITVTKESWFLYSTHPTENGRGQELIDGFMVFKATTENRSKIKSFLTAPKSVQSVTISEDNIRITLSDDYMISGTISEYIFAPLKNMDTVQETLGKKVGSAVSVLMLEKLDILPNREIIESIPMSKGLHLSPAPHFLDLDWRFSWNAIKAILEFVKFHGEGHNVCYLGCPSLAVYHRPVVDTSVASWMLLDKGHFGVTKWISENSIDNNCYKQYDVSFPIPQELTHKFDLVIMDPPWYEEYYKLFWTRAISLLKPGGIIGIAEYPGYKDKQDKLEKFRKIRQEKFLSPGGSLFYCSLEISYSPPPFEQSWKKDVDYTHPALNAYRPTFMDFYKVATPQADNEGITDVKQISQDHFPRSVKLDNLHYVRLRKSIDYAVQGKIEFQTRETMDRYQEDDKSILGWTTRNTIIKQTTAPKAVNVHDDEQLTNEILKWEFEKFREDHK